MLLSFLPTSFSVKLEEKDAIMEPDVYGRIAEYQSAFRKLHELKGDALSKDINKVKDGRGVL